MLEGTGYLIGYGIGVKLGHYYYLEHPKRKDGSPLSNDGYYITAREARFLSELFLQKSRIEQEKAKEYADMSDFDKKYYSEKHPERLPVREDFLKKMEEMAIWMRGSGGFWIH